MSKLEYGTKDAPRHFLSKWILLLWSALALTFASQAYAESELLPFTSETLAQIKADYQGNKFLLTLWSVDCPPCRVDLEELESLLKVSPDAPVVLIAADSPQREAEVMEVLEDYNLNGHVSWIFADNFFERLRFSIDPNWFGELPRSYFYNNEHKANALSGIIPNAMLWDFFDSIAVTP